MQNLPLHNFQQHYFTLIQNMVVENRSKLVYCRRKQASMNPLILFILTAEIWIFQWKCFAITLALQF